MAVLAAPRGLDVLVRDVVIADPEEDSGTRPGDLVLVIGVRGEQARRLVRAAGREGAAAVAVKGDTDRDAPALRATAVDAGVALFGVRPEVRWEQLENLARSAVDTTGGEFEVLGDLYSLAQTVATMTGGIVSIEDTASRVLAYSGSDDQADTLRRLSILGRRGPQRYLAMLREWGVYQRLWSSEEVVRVDEHPELGIRHRLAVGIHAGAQHLGTIWVQEGAAPLAQCCEQVLLGAARVAAPQLIRRRSEATAAPLRENLLTGLLDGRVDVDSVAGAIGADPHKPGVVVVFTLRAREQDRSEFELRQAELTSLISVHAAAYRRTALVTPLGSRVYVLLPDLPDRCGDSVLVLTREIVATARMHLRVEVRAGVGSVVPALAGIAASRVEADRILDATAHEPGAEIATIAEVRAKVLVNEALAMLRENDRFRDARVDALANHDAEHGSRLVPSLLAYLEAFGDVRAASARMHIHPNTLRYRVRRAEAISGIDLSNHTERLNAHLQLLLTRERCGDE